eukprot:9488464-Pyramimonas_sp.AAC.1
MEEEKYIRQRRARGWSHVSVVVVRRRRRHRRRRPSSSMFFAVRRRRRRNGHDNGRVGEIGVQGHWERLLDVLQGIALGRALEGDPEDGRKRVVHRDSLVRLWYFACDGIVVIPPFSDKCRHLLD